MEPLMTSEEAARYIGMSKSWLDISRTKGSKWFGPPWMKVGARRVLYAREDLDRWLGSRKRG